MSLRHKGREWGARSPRNIEALGFEDKKNIPLPQYIECAHLGAKLDSKPCNCPQGAETALHRCDVMPRRLVTPNSSGVTVLRQTEADGIRPVVSCRLCPKNTKHKVPKIFVAVLCCNYEQYLDAALKSVDSQTMPAARVLVVDIGSDVPVTKREGRDLLRMRTKSLWAAKEAVVAASEGYEFVLAFDGDNTLSPDYLERGVSAIQAAHAGGDKSVVFAYPDILYSDGSRDNLHPPAKLSGDAMSSTNFCDTSSVFLRSAWLSVLPTQHRRFLKNTSVWEDKLIWEEFFKRGMSGVASRGTLHYLIHTANTTHSWKDVPYYNFGYYDEVVDVGIPMSGRSDAFFKQLNGFWDLQDRDRLRPIVVLTDDTDADFAMRARDYFSHWPQVDISVLDVKGSNSKMGDRERRVAAIEYEVQHIMCRIWAHIQKRVANTFLLTLEDDVIPAKNWRELMLSQMRRNVDFVVAPYRQRHGHNHYTHWNGAFSFSAFPQNPPQESGVVEPCTGTGFGCTLFRGSVFKATPFYISEIDGDPVPYYDPQWFSRSAKALQGRVVWDAEAEHLLREPITDK